MKHIIDIKQVQHWLLGTVCLMTVAFACRACEDDYVLPEEKGETAAGETYVTLRLLAGESGDGKTRGDAMPEKEKAINNISVLVFRLAAGASEGDETLAYQAKTSSLHEEDGVGSGIYTTQVHLQKSSAAGEKYKVMVIANRGTDAGYDYLGKTIAEVQQLLLAERKDYDKDSYGGVPGTGTYWWWFTNPGSSTPEPEGIPMCGQTDFMVIDDTSFAEGYNTIDMIRALARFDVGLAFDKGTGTGDDLKTETFNGIAGYTLDNVHVYRTRSKAAVIPRTTAGGEPVLPASAVLNYGGTPGSGDVGLTYELGSSSVNAASVRQIYLPENTSTPADEATCVVVGITNTVSSEKGYYRLDMDLGKDGTLDPVLRNHRYIFSITEITGKGLPEPEDALNAVNSDITYSVIAWNESETNVWMSGEYYFQVDKRNFNLPAQAGDAETLTYITNLPADKVTWTWSTPRGWEQITTESYQAADAISYTESATTSGGVTTGVLTFHATENNTGYTISDVLNFTAGDIVGEVEIAQRALRMDYYVSSVDSIYGSYMIDSIPDDTQNYVELTLSNIQPEMLGMEWVITTDTVHNLSFGGSGVFTHTPTQKVRIYADETLGVGMESGLFTLTLDANNVAFGGVALPADKTFQVAVGFKKKTILLGGLGGDVGQYSYGAQYSQGTSPSSYYFITEGDNFSLTKTTLYDGIYPPFPVNGFTVTRGSGTEILRSYITANFLANSGDIALLGGIWFKFADATKIAKEYVDQGGVLIVFQDAYYVNNNAYGSAAAATIRLQMAKIFDDEDYEEYEYGVPPSDTYGYNPSIPGVLAQKVEIRTIGGAAAGDVIDMGAALSADPTLEDDPIISGVLGGKQYNPSLYDKGWLKWGVHRNAASWLYIKPEYEPEFIVYARDSYGHPIMVRHKKKNIIWIGAGGFIANGTSSSTNDYGGSPTSYDYLCPFAVTASTYLPKARLKWPWRPNSSNTGESVYNSAIFRNILSWAIYQAEFHGINSGGLPDEDEEGLPEVP